MSAHPGRPRRGLRVLIGAVVLGAAAGCGIPADTDFRGVDPAVIPSGLVDPTTTSSTSTTTIPVPSTAPAPTTTEATEAVTLYFLTGGLLTAVERPLPKGATLEDVVRVLSVGPILEEDPALRSALQFGTTGRVTEQGGVAAVALEPTFADTPAIEQRLAFAQLVFTLTSRPGIGQVEFTVEGRTVAVPRPDGSLQARPASKEDFSELLLVPSTSVPTTTAPESSGEPSTTINGGAPAPPPV